ncbi:MAG: hypothetical protein H7Y22_13830 [Gemmatimonadaceae bacterium]|nr:hypothetical protein [Gloeobacterales cyanobacterium ES-bin-141]
MFNLAEILDMPWARAALSEQFIVWRGEGSEWKLYLPCQWPVKTWHTPPSGELVVEGTETIRSLIGGEEWRAFTRTADPLFKLIESFPKIGHWDEDEEVELFAPFLQAGIGLLGLGAECFKIEADGTVHFVPQGLPAPSEAQVQQLLDKKPRAWKARPPRGSTWTPEWQLLWLWLDAARSFWGSHFVNPVSPLTKAYTDLPVRERATIRAGHPQTLATTHTASRGHQLEAGGVLVVTPNASQTLEAFFEQCTDRQTNAQLRLTLEGGKWSAHVVVQSSQFEINPTVQLQPIKELAERTGLAALLNGDAWTGGWALVRGEGTESWVFEARSSLLSPAFASWLPRS